LFLVFFAAVPKQPLVESGHAPHRLDSRIQVARGPQKFNKYIGKQCIEGDSIGIISRAFSVADNSG
jgi:hypothetical protein